ncbi:MAG TPA: enoyl-CoA hydratase-related protein [Alphaproteobacteria bacterium]|nr:enoyl-CoA hydratase-related protein [Alphaproteobacteria bacterium]
MPDILFEVKNKIATITLNRPETRNAFSDEMLLGWAAALRESQAREDVNVVVLTGVGKAFCSGGDLSTMGKDETPNQFKEYLLTRVHPVARAVSALDKPYICAVNGAATGAGMDMTLYADIRFAAASARFAESYVNVGLAPGDGGAFLLPRLVGLTRALELLWTGDLFSAEEAERLGIVSKVLPDDQLMAHTYAFAERLANGPSLAIRMTKKAVYDGLRSDLFQALESVSSHMGVLSFTHDHIEAVKAFREKRKPEFKGR